MTLEETLANIHPASKEAYDAAQKHWDSLAKPLGGLGYLEDALCRIAGALGSSQIRLDKRALAVFCADNGVLAEGVSQTGSEVTAIVTENICNHITSMCHMAALANCEVLAVDMGVLTEIDHPGLYKAAVARGTGNIAKGAAMSRQQALCAIQTGIALARQFKAQGCTLLTAGEMGIGNTTTASAVVSVLLQRPPAEVTGRGAGLSSEGLRRKVGAIEAALRVNRPTPGDPVDILSKVGGFDIAAMCGFYLGAAAQGLPVILDGFISGAAALCAVRLCPACEGYLLASHISTEPAAQLILEALHLRPILTAGMHLGEGSGAIALLPLLDMALAVYKNCPSFAACSIEAYTPQV